MTIGLTITEQTIDCRPEAAFHPGLLLLELPAGPWCLGSSKPLHIGDPHFFPQRAVAMPHTVATKLRMNRLQHATLLWIMLEQWWMPGTKRNRRMRQTRSNQSESEKNNTHFWLEWERNEGFPFLTPTIEPPWLPVSKLLHALRTHTHAWSLDAPIFLRPNSHQFQMIPHDSRPTSPLLSQVSRTHPNLQLQSSKSAHPNKTHKSTLLVALKIEAWHHSRPEFTDHHSQI